MDDLAGLDRLDWWLNAQRGPRRLLLLWLDAYPLGFALCYALWACWSFKGDFGRGALTAGAVALLMAIPVVFVLFGQHALRVAEMRRKPGKAWARLCWRRLASRFLIASMLVIDFTVFADNQYGKPHPVLLSAQWFQAVIGIGCVALMSAEDLYAKQVGRRRAPAQAHGSGGKSGS